MQQRRGPRQSRRTVLALGATGLATMAGCIDAPFGDSGPETRTFRIALAEDEGEISAAIDPSGDVEDVITVQVGDEVTFEVENRRADPTVFHNHVPHEEITVDPGETRTMTFTPTEEQIGTHEVEVFDGESTSASDDHHDSGDDHDATTEDDHDATTEDDHDDGHDAAEIYVILTVEVRPAGS